MTKKQKTLYMTDLDGTFLTSEKKVSKYSAEKMNQLIEQGIQFSVATARTPATVVDLLEGLHLALPIVVMNGAGTYSIEKNEYINVEFIEESVAKKVDEIMKAQEQSYFTYCIRDHHIYAYYPMLDDEKEVEFVDERDNSPRKTFLKGEVENYKEVVYFVMMDKKEVVQKAYEEIKHIEGISGVVYKDVYEEDVYFLEIYKSDVSKAAAIKKVKDEYGYDKLVCFGDNLNDLPMFEVADEAYAVENAKEEVKKISTDIIESNDHDGVTKWIEKNGKKV